LERVRERAKRSGKFLQNSFMDGCWIGNNRASLLLVESECCIKLHWITLTVMWPLIFQTITISTRNALDTEASTRNQAIRTLVENWHLKVGTGWNLPVVRAPVPIKSMVLCSISCEHNSYLVFKAGKSHLLGYVITCAGLPTKMFRSNSGLSPDS
jgi:hypothetical protein